MAKKKKEDGHFTLSVNGHTLSGKKVGGLWQFTCEDWPDLAAEFNGSKGPGAITSRFLGMCLHDPLTPGGKP